MMEAAVCWMLGYFPDAQFIYTSYGHELAATSTRYIQQVIVSEWYQTIFTTRLGGVKQADNFTTREGGKVYGDGVGGLITGIGAGLKRPAGGFIIIDDPAKPDEALSKAESEKIRFWFENTLKSRRNSSTHTPIVICAQRLAEDDLPGFILRNYPDDTVHLKFPGMVNGESIIPETVSTQALLDTQRVNPFAFAAQYQQEPVVFGGNLIKIADFVSYDPNQSIKWEKKIITGDTAFSVKESADFSVLQCWGKLGPKAYLIDQVRGKWDSPELLTVAKAFYLKHNLDESRISKMTIEEKASGIGLIQQLKREGIPADGVERTKDKTTRVHEILPYIATGMVCVPKYAPWLAAFISECAGFREDGKHKNDDQVDCLCDGIWHTLGKPRSIFEVLGDTKRLARLGV